LEITQDYHLGYRPEDILSEPQLTGDLKSNPRKQCGMVKRLLIAFIIVLFFTSTGDAGEFLVQDDTAKAVPQSNREDTIEIPDLWQKTKGAISELKSEERYESWQKIRKTREASSPVSIGGTLRHF
jgi:hypothetical protein